MRPPGSPESGRYVVVTPARNEARHLPALIDSVARQTAVPARWVIVDDGSTDLTADILEHAARTHAWISSVRRSDRGHRQPGTGVVAAFYAGYETLGRTGWDFLVKLDADLVLPPDYFRRCLDEFRRDRRLGIGGGCVYHVSNGLEVIERNPQFHVRGATKIYRRDCWEAIGGLLHAPGWDTVDEVKAHMLGWRTRTFPDIPVRHLRPTGSADGAWRDAVKNGRANYVAGYHPVFMLLKCGRRLLEKPYGVVTAGLLYGFASGYAQRLPQVDDPRFIRYIRAQQLRRLLLASTIWR